MLFVAFKVMFFLKVFADQVACANVPHLDDVAGAVQGAQVVHEFAGAQILISVLLLLSHVESFPIRVFIHVFCYESLFEPNALFCLALVARQVGEHVYYKGADESSKLVVDAVVLNRVKQHALIGKDSESDWKVVLLPSAVHVVQGVIAALVVHLVVRKQAISVLLDFVAELGEFLCVGYQIDFNQVSFPHI